MLVIWVRWSVFEAKCASAPARQPRRGDAKSREPSFRSCEQRSAQDAAWVNEWREESTWCSAMFLDGFRRRTLGELVLLLGSIH